MEVVIDPYVAMSILDHHMRRPEVELEAGKPDRVTGLLLGTTVKSTINIRNFCPTHDQTTYTMVQRSAPNELGIGWYTTGFVPEDLDTIHQTIQLRRPLLVVVTLPNEKCADLTFRAFQTFDVILGEASKPEKVLKELPCVVAPFDNVTNVAIDTLVSQMFPAEAKASDPARLPSSTKGDDYLAELRNIQKNLLAAQTYVNDVIAGKKPANKEVGRRLSELLVTDRVAAVSPSVVQEKMQDVLMIQYISKVLGQQLQTLQQTAPLLNKY